MQSEGIREKGCGGLKRQKVYVRGKKARDRGGSTAQKKENKQEMRWGQAMAAG